MSKLARAKSKVPVGKEEEDSRIGSGPNVYQLGAEIGRGGFGVVFQAFNLRTGDFVAVKRFPLNSIDKESLSSIEGEIELMQKLNHPNIVKYIDTIRTKSYLYIVLEYMENGSLSNVIKKFGFFSESLTAIYITQVLRGLRYLHEQGVLHRDIKGANILTTKEGMVKLADFGVAIKLSEAHADDQDVVGSPYWIAPEIIEMSAPTPSCDIWSVGCIIIELLTGKPPYFDLEPMAALFRIVQDDYPPFPEGISQALRDFLLNCFQKEPVMRSSAAKLLEHPWLTISSTNTKLEEQTKRLNFSKSSSSIDLHVAPATDSIMNTIRLHQREVSPATPAMEPPGGSIDGIAMRAHFGSAPPQDLKVSSGEVKDDSSRSSRQGRPSMRSTPMRTPHTSTSPRAQRSHSFFRSYSGVSANSGTTPAVVLAPESYSICDSPAVNSTSSSVGHEVPLETLSQRGLVKHEGSDSAPMEHCRSMSPISDSTVATKDNNRKSAYQLPSDNADRDSDSDFARGFSDDENPINARHAAFFTSAKMASDSDEDNWDNAVVDKMLSASMDSLGGSPTRAPSTQGPSVRPGSRSSSASEKRAEQMSLRNRSVDLVAKLKSASLNVTTGSSFVLATETKAKDSKGGHFLSPSIMSSNMLTKFQEDEDDANFDELFNASSIGPQYSGNAAPKKQAKNKKAAMTMKSLRAADDLQPTLLQSSDTYEWQTREDLKGSDSSSVPAAGPVALTPRTASRGHQLRKVGTRESMDTLHTLSSSDDFDDLGFEDDLEADGFASKLRSKLSALGKETDKEEEPDEFINYQFDEKDFKQNEQKDIHFRRSREVVDFLSKIRPSSTEEELSDAVEHIIDIFDEYPEQREHLITYHGVMPIIDMFESRAPTTDRHSSPTSSESPSSANYSRQVLVIVNKIIGGSVRAQEQLALMGIIPTVMNMLEKSCRPNTPNRAVLPFAPYVASAPLYSSSSTPRPSRLASDSSSAEAAPAVNERNLSQNYVDPVTMEAAKFIHQISLSSSLTLQMLIGAGGLMVLTTLVSFGAKISAPSFRSGYAPSSTSTSSSSTAAVAALLSPPKAGLAPLAEGHSTSSEDMEGRDTGRAENAPPLLLPSAESTLLSQSADFAFDVQSLKVNIPPPPFNPEEAENCMTMFQMGMDCIAQLFSVQSSRTRDFCRLFVKLGLLSHLSVAFGNLKRMYYDMMRCASLENKNEGALGGAVVNPGSGRSGGTSHRRSDSVGSVFSVTDSFFTSEGVANIQYNVAADDTQERVYAHMIATLFFKFSRSDSVVAETMANPEKGVIRVILEALTMSELQSLPISPNSVGVTPTSTYRSLPLPDNHSTSNLSLMATASSVNMLPLLPLSQQPTQHPHLLSASTPFATSTRKSARLVSTLSPAYLEMLELLLKCLKNLSMEPSALADLERAGTIETILPLLSGPLRDRYIVHILPCLFNMCRINKRRQELAASLGIVPHLKKVIAEGSHLRQFALPIIFDLAHTSNATRLELWKHDCVSFYVNLLKENYWQAFALNSLAVWISHDANNVSKLLVQPLCLTKLIDFFDKASNQTLHSLHKPLLDIMSKSSELSSMLSYSGTFVLALVRRLNSPQEAIVLRTLLKMLQLLHQHHANPRQLVLDHGLYDIVKEFAQSESQVLVCQIANRLLMDFQVSTMS